MKQDDRKTSTIKRLQQTYSTCNISKCNACASKWSVVCRFSAFAGGLAASPELRTAKGCLLCCGSWIHAQDLLQVEANKPALLLQSAMQVCRPCVRLLGKKLRVRRIPLNTRNTKQKKNNNNKHQQQTSQYTSNTKQEEEEQQQQTTTKTNNSNINSWIERFHTP